MITADNGMYDSKKLALPSFPGGSHITAKADDSRDDDVYISAMSSSISLLSQDDTYYHGLDANTAEDRGDNDIHNDHTREPPPPSSSGGWNTSNGGCVVEEYPSSRGGELNTLSEHNEYAFDEVDEDANPLIPTIATETTAASSASASASASSREWKQRADLLYDEDGNDIDHDLHSWRQPPPLPVDAVNHPQQRQQQQQQRQPLHLDARMDGTTSQPAQPLYPLEEDDIDEEEPPSLISSRQLRTRLHNQKQNQQKQQKQEKHLQHIHRDHPPSTPPQTHPPTFTPVAVEESYSYTSYSSVPPPMESPQFEGGEDGDGDGDGDWRREVQSLKQHQFQPHPPRGRSIKEVGGRNGAGGRSGSGRMGRGGGAVVGSNTSHTHGRGGGGKEVVRTD